MEPTRQSLTLGSLFDGIGGWQLAAMRNGIKPIWSSEIEPYPMAVTKAHFPDTIQLGDITKLRGENLPPVDIICAGSPCQDLSVAGRQKGLQGERSGLFYQSIQLFYAIRRKTNGKYPRYFVWENVPGAFSSNRGEDFHSVLEEIGQTRLPMPDRKWAKAGLVELPGSSMPNIGAYPKEEHVSSLSQILEPRSAVPQNCYLSSRACKGILRRAENRTGKPLPEALKKALVRQAESPI